VISLSEKERRGSRPFDQESKGKDVRKGKDVPLLNLPLKKDFPSHVSKGRRERGANGLLSGRLKKQFCHPAGKKKNIAPAKAIQAGGGTSFVFSYHQREKKEERGGEANFGDGESQREGEDYGLDHHPEWKKEETGLVTAHRQKSRGGEGHFGKENKSSSSSTYKKLAKEER